MAIMPQRDGRFLQITPYIIYIRDNNYLINMEFIEQFIKGVWVIKPKRFGDQRGYFSETFKLAEFQSHIGEINFVQDNESFSTHGVLRGLHYQQGEWSQAKLVRVSQGRVLDVAVDLRGDSPTFGQHVAVELDASEGTQLFIPRGFAHGFVVLSEVAQFQYKVDNVYAPQSEMSIMYNDPALAIDWRLPASQLVLSEKDQRGTLLKNIKPF